jgi:hypothetical protein
MSGEQDHWLRQKREIQAYNTFFSALSARANPCLAAHGFEAPVEFPRIEGAREGVAAHPDFLLYDGSVFLLVEIKQGTNIEDRHIKQMDECNRVGIERAETYLRDSEVQEKTSYDGNVDQIETCIVYEGIDEDYIRKCRNEWDNCREKLEKLEEQTAILTQGRGESLRLLTGEFDSTRLQSRFESGVDLPENPKTEFVVTESWEKECLAVAISHTWGHQAASGPVQISASDIRSHFAPRHAVPMGRIKRVLHFLNEIDACSKVDDEEETHRYEFTVDHMQAILDIEQTVSEQSVEDYLMEDDQTDLDSFMDPDEDGDDDDEDAANQ